MYSQQLRISLHVHLCLGRLSCTCVVSRIRYALAYLCVVAGDLRIRKYTKAKITFLCCFVCVSWSRALLAKTYQHACVCRTLARESVMMMLYSCISARVCVQDIGARKRYDDVVLLHALRSQPADEECEHGVDPWNASVPLHIAHPRSGEG